MDTAENKEPGNIRKAVGLGLGLGAVGVGSLAYIKGRQSSRKAAVDLIMASSSSKSVPSKLVKDSMLLDGVGQIQRGIGGATAILGGYSVANSLNKKDNKNNTDYSRKTNRLVNFSRYVGLN